MDKYLINLINLFRSNIHARAALAGPARAVVTILLRVPLPETFNGNSQSYQMRLKKI